MKLREFLRLFRGSCLRQGAGGISILQRIRTRHHMNSIDKKLGGDARFFLVLSEAKKSEPGNEHDRRIGIT